jgi:hypothetical protein
METTTEQLNDQLQEALAVVATRNEAIENLKLEVAQLRQELSDRPELDPLAGKLVFEDTEEPQEEPEQPIVDVLPHRHETLVDGAVCASKALLTKLKRK